ncbi:MAG: hypothetical protein M0Z55_00410 [Peptococcaceae bacterium]|nr:hypothetical protein [Peptococcaceae bacterium]
MEGEERLMVWLKSRILLALSISLVVCAITFIGGQVRIAHADTTQINSQSSSITPTNEQMKSQIDILQSRLINLETRVNNVENRLNSMQSRVSLGALSFLFGAFCALWAQNNRRNAFGWFLAGLIFSVFAVLVVLYLNPKEN